MMKKYLPYIFILMLSIGFSTPLLNAHAADLGICYETINAEGQTVDSGRVIGTNVTQASCQGNWLKNGSLTPQQQKAAEASVGPATHYDESEGFWMTYLVKPAMTWIVQVMLTLVALLTGIGGLVLNGVVYNTVVKVSENYANLPAINEAWKVIRDVANMGFIFVLLYAAIQTILGIGSDVKKLIVNIILVAIVINFSLFFTKIVIDISNILALMFYDAIVPGSAQQGFASGTLSLTQGLTGAGLSDAFMKNLNLQSLYMANEPGQLTFMAIITTGIMGSIMLLIAAFVFFAVAIMFVIRYVILILVLILSPIAFVSFVLPGLKGRFTEWWKALSAQAFFAPIYFMLTWVTLTVLDGLTKSKAFGTGGSLSSVGLAGDAATAGFKNISSYQGFFPTFINFSVVIVFLIASLVLSKKWADSAGGGIGKITSWATGIAGGASIGVAGRFGRNTIGRAGAMVGDSKFLKDRKEAGGISGAGARLALLAGRKTSEKSFDLRATGVGSFLDAGKAQKGGYADALKKKREGEKKFADSLGPSEEEKQKAEAARKRLEKGLEADPNFMREYDSEKSRRINEATKLEENIAKRNAVPLDNMTEQQKFNHQAETERMKAKAQENRKNVATALAYADSILGTNREKIKARQDEVEEEKKEAIKSFSSESPAGKTEMEAIRKNVSLKEEVDKKEEELATTVTPTAIAAIKNELEEKKKELEASKIEMEAAETVANEGREQITKIYDERKNSIIEIKSIGERRKEAHAQNLETGWLSGGKIAQKIEESVPDGRAGNFIRPIVQPFTRAISYSGHAAAAEIRKGKKPVKDRLEEILREEGELPASGTEGATPAPESGSPAASPAPTV